MKLKNVFLLLAIISVMVVTMPEIYSLFTGQHDWYDIIPSGIQIPCLKCHSNIKQEIDAAGVMNFDCQTCHVNDTSLYGSDRHGNVAKPRCLNCHSYIETKLSNDAHRFFIEGARSSGLHKDENEACISCHTKKSLNIKFTFADIYKLAIFRDLSGVWQVSGSKALEKGIKHNAIYNDPSKVNTGQHQFVGKVNVVCEKCHSDIRGQLNTSVHYRKACRECHLKEPESGYNHAAAVPRCLDCHSYIFDNPGISNNVNRDIEAHMPLIDFGINSNELKNVACSSCHSTFTNQLNFSRPEYIEWDVVAYGEDNWSIENVTLGPMKKMSWYKKLDDKLHNITRNINCPSCHQDIRDAVMRGGHANEQWKKEPHNYRDYRDMITYCRSCHKPIVNIVGYENHGGMKISCIDCHSKNIRVDIRRNGDMKEPPFPSGDMGNIDQSMAKYNKNLQSYFCIACKNTGLPKPEGDRPLHFKIYTEPNVTIYLDGRLRYNGI